MEELTSEPQVPADVLAIAQSGRATLKFAIVELLRANPAGLRNIDVARSLGLQSDNGDPQKNRLTWSLLQDLEREGRVRRGEGRHPVYSAV